jgi:hypothetical protein
MEVQKIAAFSDGDIGGNPAGVVISDRQPGYVAAPVFYFTLSSG